MTDKKERSIIRKTKKRVERELRENKQKAGSSIRRLELNAQLDLITQLVRDLGID